MIELLPIKLLNSVLGTNISTTNLAPPFDVIYIYGLMILSLIIMNFESFYEAITPRGDKIHKLKKMNMDSMEGPAFENFCAKVLKLNGFDHIKMTPSSSDRGVDITARKGGKLFAIQCKRYSKNVGNKAIQEAYSGKSIYKADYAVVMTNSHFTKQAKQDAAKLHVLLWDRSIVMKFLSFTLNNNDIPGIGHMS